MNIFQKKKKFDNDLLSLEIKKNVYLRASLTGILFGFVIMIIPTLICINLLLLYNYVMLLMLLIALFIGLGATIGFYFYYEALKSYEPKVKELNTKYAFIYNSMGAFITVLFVLIVVYIMVKCMKII